MLKSQKYRYTLQFGMETEEECRAGQLLEKLGYRKSKIIVAALNEYMDNHPDLLAGQHKMQFQIKSVSQEQLETCVRRIVAECLGTDLPVEKGVELVKTTSAQVSEDILEMLGDLDYFG